MDAIALQQQWLLDLTLYVVIDGWREASLNPMLQKGTLMQKF